VEIWRENAAKCMAGSTTEDRPTRASVMAAGVTA